MTYHTEIYKNVHTEIYKNVNLEWNKETHYLDIRNQNGEQLALLYVEEID